MKVLFVCLGNICRSPTAEGVFRHCVLQAGMVQQIEIDSAGTGDWHIGEPPDRRAQMAARQRGYDLSSQRARQVTTADFHIFDDIIAMDHSNVHNLRAIAPDSEQEKVHLLLSFHPESDLTEVPDPYYEGGFDEVLDLIEAASQGLLARIRDDMAER